MPWTNLPLREERTEAFVLPNFLVIGAMKGGTDSLWQYLRHHSQVFMSETKELDFFTAEINWSRGRSWYERQFDGAGDAVAVGEASTSYTKHPVHHGVPGRIAELLPQARLVYVVRHPVERLRSHYLHETLLGHERDPIEEAVFKNPVYLDFSRYALQIEQYLQHFGRDQLLVITSEGLRADRRATMDTVSRFLGVNGGSPNAVLEHEFHSTGEKRVLRSPFLAIQRIPGYRQMARLAPRFLRDSTHRLRTRGIDVQRAAISDRFRQHLEDELREDVKRLRKYLGRDFGGWGIAEGRGSVMSP